MTQTLPRTLRSARRPLPPEAFTREETYAETRLPVTSATTLIPDAYTSEEFYALEQERVFATTWVAVGCTSDLKNPGDAIVADAAGQSIIVVRNKEGQLRAFYNVCRHRGAQLLTPDQTHVRKFFRCPYHSWAYDFDGRCLGTPLFTDSAIPEDQQAIFDMRARKFDKADYGLLPVHVDTWGCLVFVNLEAEPMPLAEQLGDLATRLGGYRLDEQELVRTMRYDVKANYKLIAENFMECYHIPWVHPGLAKISPAEDHYRYQGPGMYMGMCTTPLQPGDEFKALRPIDGLTGTDPVSGRYCWVFPNVAVAALPNHTFVILAIPTRPDYTIEKTYLLVHPDSLTGPDLDGALDRLADFWDLVNREDVSIVERVQEGLKNRAYGGGRICYGFEEPIHRFQSMVIDRMVGIRRVPPGDAEEGRPMYPKPNRTR